ncbi:agmatine deiminase family protein [Sinomonas atrocyanea]|jgi:agmatine deiminase|uniref:agmatine deiminase family protein n=1 Tax=Sinomonas atrocyanea TaxID=37927 RepID=UPI00286542E2|nr:agmatine deiminase family protein [Sinomonas atrocyanea]MDR6620322.1 agmatine deiminase [Sinomonas atrocyanea]
MSWRMPAETDPHERLWMAWPSGGYTLGETDEDAHESRSAWAAVAHAARRYEPVTVVVRPEDRRIAEAYLDPRVDLLEAPLDDAWMRDMGPSFVLGGPSDDAGTTGGGPARLGAVDWVFNGWGQQDWASWENDARIGGTVAAAAGAEPVRSLLVNEGGGIQVDGRGTVLLTETVQLDPGRNPGVTKAQVEAELERTIGARHAVWLPRGLTRDSERFGTRGHVDLVAAIPSPGTLLVHVQHSPEHPDHEVTGQILEALHASRTVDGTPWTIIEVPAPAQLHDEEGWVDFSYINHVAVNGGLVACTFNDPHDEKALRLLADAYRGRHVSAVDARVIFSRGGGIHCITQQQPAIPAHA